MLYNLALAFVTITASTLLGRLSTPFCESVSVQILANTFRRAIVTSELVLDQMGRFAVFTTLYPSVVQVF